MSLDSAQEGVRGEQIMLGGGESAARDLACDPEELLVHHGWRSLCRCAEGDGQQITIVRALHGPQNEWRLSQREFQLIYLAALGLAGKEAASLLALSWTAVRAAMSSATRKLGLRSCSQVPVFWHGLVTGERAFVQLNGVEVLEFRSSLGRYELEGGLTRAQRDILAGVVLGETNREIALRRSTSERTVANQVAALLRRLRATTRNELATKVLCTLPASQHERWLRAKR